MQNCNNSLFKIDKSVKMEFVRISSHFVTGTFSRLSNRFPDTYNYAHENNTGDDVKTYLNDVAHQTNIFMQRR